jgi:soluble P-type ATPase
MWISLPQDKRINIETIVLDLNGTLAVYGQISDTTQELIQTLKSLGYQIVLVSGDIRGNGQEWASRLGIQFISAQNSDEKWAAMQHFKKEHTAAIGNARIDIGTFKHAALSIATLQDEGIHAGILSYVDIIVPSIDAALNLFIQTQSLEATLRE